MVKSKIKKLKVGQVAKNYKEMCVLLGEEPEAGNSKKSQLKEWKRYFDYEKSGQSFTITEIYDKPLPDGDNRSRGNNSIYVDYIMYLLMYHFSKTDGYVENFYKVQLYKLLGMVNSNYTERILQKDKKTLIDNFDNVTDYDMSDFFKRVPPKLEKILFTALNNLKRRCLLEYFEEYEITEQANNNGSNISISRVATNDEIKEIININHEVLEDMGYKNMWQVYYSSQSDKFYSEVHKLQYERYGWSKVFKRYKIIFSKENMAKDLHLVAEEIQRKLLNEAVCGSVNNQAKERFDKDYIDPELWKEWGITDISENNYGLMSGTYLLAQKELANYFIRLQI